MSAKNNPFKEKSKSYIDYETLSDLKYHCSKCELVTSQGGKTFNTWINEKGINMKKPIKKFCPNCNQIQVFRALENLEINDFTKKRKPINNKNSKRIKKILGNKDSITQKILNSSESEIDHRIPQVRWNKDEEDINNLSDDQIVNKFQLLTRTENLTKSRCCENCVKTGIRSSNPYFPDELFYEGNSEYDSSIGCSGCFWYNPTKWFEYYKKTVINSAKKNRNGKG